ncbi:hypothetical protein [Porcipelethomonas sp.]|uniref:hypothetical protein n=1 Tax=Porcipelethomonas sp. TaxID=2981675 RepID=UPI0030771F5C
MKKFFKRFTTLVSAAVIAASVSSMGASAVTSYSYGTNPVLKVLYQGIAEIDIQQKQA